jgi:hypothetical protein
MITRLTQAMRGFPSHRPMTPCRTITIDRSNERRRLSGAAPGEQPVTTTSQLLGKSQDHASLIRPAGPRRPKPCCDGARPPKTRRITPISSPVRYLPTSLRC